MGPARSLVQGCTHIVWPLAQAGLLSSRQANACCDICLEELPGSSFHAIGGCVHRFCRGCLRGHVRAVIQGRTYPVLCPEPGCNNSMAPDECELLLAESASDVAMYHQVQVEASIPPELRFYCPNPRCSVPFQLDMPKPAPNNPLNWAMCGSKICASCRVEWHKGFSCEEFQALPSALKKHEDVLFLDVARSKRWRQCAQCGHMIELREGCRHMTCTCSFEFCYTCGKPWEKPGGVGPSRRTCTCALSEVPPDTPPAAGRIQPIAVAHERRYLPRDQQQRHPVPEDIPSWVPDGRVPVWKTALCRFYLAGECRHRNCYFAHGEEELRTYGHYGSRPRR